MAVTAVAALATIATAKTGMRIFFNDGTRTTIESSEIDHVEFYDDFEDTTLDEVMGSMDGIVKLDKSMIGESIWEEGFVSSDSFILTTGIGNEFKKVRSFAEHDSETPEGTAGDETENTIPCIAVMDAGKTNVFYLFLDEFGDPSQLVAGTNTLFFNFLNDEVLELTLSNGAGLSYIGTVHVDREALKAAMAASDFSFLFQARLAVVVALLENAAIPAEFQEAVGFFKTITKLEMAKDQTATLETLIENGLLNDSGVADFVEDTTEKVIEIISEVKYSIVLWTGKASFKVGGTSCTLSGTIHCASDNYNELGTYGIVCDTDPENLYVDKAEYVGTAVQKDNSFDVDFRGLKAKTQYYYRAFYKFNDPENHGNLVFKYGDTDAEIGYDTVTKDFITGDNRLEVDVVMCIDVTGSMSDIIHTVKQNAMSFYDAFNDKCLANGIELDGLNNKVIAFQDINEDGDRWWMESPFYSLPEEKESFDNFVSVLYADGGGDTPESGLEALMGAFSALEEAVDDGYHRQVVILWTDAPYLADINYTEYTVPQVLDKWNSLSSGRRLILFAPSGNYEDNGGAWDMFDGEKNIIHSTNLYGSFSDFDFILDSIIEELIGKGSNPEGAVRRAAKSNGIRIIAKPNK